MNRPGMWLVLCLLAACSRAAVDKKSITVGIQQEPDSLLAPFKEMNAAEEVVRAGQVALTLFDDRWKLQPWAAVAIPTVENGGVQLLPDGRMRTRWRLRDDYVWPDGKPLTAQDFIFTLSIYQDRSQEIADRSTTDQVERMESPDPDGKTLLITWKHPYAYHAGYRNFEALPAHVVGPILKDVGSGLKSHAYGRQPLLAGAFTVADWEEGQHITLVRNPGAAGTAHQPWADRLVYRFIPQTAGLEAALVSGALDAISPIGLLMDQAVALQKRHGDRFDFHFTDGLQWEHVDFNLDDPWLKDVRMRRAIMMALNRQAMVDAIFQGRQKVADGPVPPRRYDYEPEIRRYPYDPGQARALLDDMGFQLGADGIRRRDGIPLRFTIQTTSGNTTRERMEQVMQDDLRKVGIQLDIENLPARVLFGEVTRHRRFKHMVLFTWALDPLKAQDAMWRCDAIPTPQNGWVGQNYGGWCQTEATQAFQEAERELDENRRREWLRKAQRIWSEDLPAIPLYFRSDVSVTRKGFRNWRPTGTLTPVTWNAHEWQVMP